MLPLSARCNIFSYLLHFSNPYSYLVHCKLQAPFHRFPLFLSFSLLHFLEINTDTYILSSLFIQDFDFRSQIISEAWTYSHSALKQQREEKRREENTKWLSLVGMYKKEKERNLFKVLKHPFQGEKDEHYSLFCPLDLFFFSLHFFPYFLNQEKYEFVSFALLHFSQSKKKILNPKVSSINKPSTFRDMATLNEQIQWAHAYNTQLLSSSLL